MCCFSQPVKSVSSTRIFARPDSDGRQFLVYSMEFEADRDLAMILPLPVRLPSGEKDVRFFDLKDYPEFFNEMDQLFAPPPAMRGLHGVAAGLPMSASAALPVITVGEFEASFVPSQADFERLDPRFRIKASTWKKAKGYEDFGFAVFKLKKGAMKVHPMAFLFPRRDPKTLFFPTLHIHDGEIHDVAEFDHILYCQPGEGGRPKTKGWEESFTQPAIKMQVPKARGIVLPAEHCYKLSMQGVLANQDTTLPVVV